MKPQKVLHLHLEEAKKNPKISGKYIVTEKLDGWFGYIDFVEGVCGNITSGAGRSIPSMIWAKDVFQKINISGNVRLIFEIIIPSVPFHILNGIFNRSIGECQATDARFRLHDIVDFNNNVTAINRVEILKALDLSRVSEYIEVIPVLAVTNDKEVWMEHFKEVTDRGGEGIVIKQASSYYQPEKRNSSLMKVKLESTFDLECIGVFNTIGEKGNSNLNATLKRKNGVVITVRIPKDEDVKLFESNGWEIVGKVVEVKCMCELVGGMLREPRFVAVRHNKLIGDID